MIDARLFDLVADEAAKVAALAGALGGNMDIDLPMLFQRDIALQPPGLWSPNRHCRLVEAADGWLAVNMAREDDLACIPAWLECEIAGDPWRSIIGGAKKQTAVRLRDRAVLLGLPVSIVGEAQAASPPVLARAVREDRRLRVVDLSALWAGPLCGALLAQAGMDVTRIESPSRPDPTAISTPQHSARLNGSKRRIDMDLHSPRLLQEIAAADVLITSARSPALARLGISLERLSTLNPGLIWVAITGHGFAGADAMRVGFGDDTAAAGGLVAWSDGVPRFIGDALADPLTGLRAAHLALQAVVRAQSGLIDVALAPTAACFAQRAGLA
ncbi:CoA transferase [Blastomonas sp.]|uniref:CoA transferase n=1 Tax=Blastomonas sp. TaxID=1909299 RepID=UPI003919A450